MVHKILIGSSSTFIDSGGKTMQIMLVKENRNSKDNPER